MQAAPCVLRFHPDAYSLPDGIVMGRHMAGHTFLKAFLGRQQEAGAETIPILVERSEHAQAFVQLARSLGCEVPVRALGPGQRGVLASAGGVLHNADPGLTTEAWRRGFHGHGGWSLTGITHTTATARVAEEISGYLTAPVQPWDALICTSRAVKGHVEEVLGGMAEHLRARLGVGRLVLPQLPVIPLGVNSEEEEFRNAAELRPRARKELGLEPEEVVVLFVGRLSFHAKAHPVPMYRALEQAQRELQRDGGATRLVLVEFGVHGLDTVKRAYEEAARLCCPSVRCLHLDGRDDALRQQAWAVADLFCSLSDNIQEAFGITPLEAMAAGLPVVVSDWDGYRDTVRHGIDGFRVSTVAPSPGLGQDLAFRQAMNSESYDRYVGAAAAVTAVQAAGVAEAFVALARAPELRRRMGAAGRQRARQTYDWKVVIGQYEELWRELAQRRQGAGELKGAWPARMDPFAAFGGYPSGCLTEDFMLCLPGTAEASRREAERLRGLAMVSFAERMLPSEQEMAAVIRLLGEGPLPAGELVDRAAAAPRRRGPLLRALGWMLKMGVIEAQAWPPVSAVPGTAARSSR